jgi:hypothetical protein
VAITTQSGLVTALNNRVVAPWVKTQVSVNAVLRNFALFKSAGNPTSGTTPSVSGVALTNATSGALPLPSASGTVYVAGFEACNSLPETIILYDRLIETAGLDGTSITAQTVNSASLPTRNTGGVGVELWLEIYTALGATTATVSISYTNSSATSGQIATATLSGSPAQRQTIPCVLQAGDVGIQSVQSVTLSISTGTVGSFGITLRQQIGPIINGSAPVNAEVANPLGWAECGLAQVAATACLELVIADASTAGSGVISGSLSTIAG